MKNFETLQCFSHQKGQNREKSSKGFAYKQNRADSFIETFRICHTIAEHLETHDFL